MRPAELLRQAGWIINDKRVERIWRREGLKVPHRQPKRGRLWLADGSCIRLRPQHRNHVWSYDLSRTAPMMDTGIGCSTCSTSSPTNAWRRKWSCQGPDSIKSKPIGQSSDEAKRREEVSGELVITRGDAAEVLEATEAALDDVATFVGQLVIANARLAIGLAGNDGVDSLLLEIGAERISVITFVSDQLRQGSG